MVVELRDPKQIDSLEIRIGEESYMIPLGTAMTVKQLKALRTDEDIYAFIGQHMPEEVVDRLTFDNLAQIMKAWRDETERVSGINMGES